ncbi:helix-turn-helix transcriptional regulator [Streptomyces mirabilis]
MARALGVSPSTVAGWESGRDPGGETREKYAYLLKGADAKITGRDTTASEPAAADPYHEEQGELTTPQPCVLCGHPARHEVAGPPPAPGPRRMHPGPHHRRTRTTRRAAARPGAAHTPPLTPPAAAARRSCPSAAAPRSRT